MTAVANAVRLSLPAAAGGQQLLNVRVALLGLGKVGSAVAELARAHATGPHRFTIGSALVRSTCRARPVDGIPLVTHPAKALDVPSDVVVELLGGIEPARTLLLNALAAGIPVVTANKSVLATHGDELFEAAARSGAPLLYEGSVLAGVPFLGTFSRRPWIRDVTAVFGIVNGTTNFILSRMAAERVPFDRALRDAQHAGYAEPDPAKDLAGDDAVEKLCVLVRHFGGWSVRPEEIETAGIQQIEQQDLEQAAKFGGMLRPVIVADWIGGRMSACVGPAFVPASNPLARIDGVQNAVILRTRWSGDLFYSGPGAGPTVTAATVLDDIIEAYEGVHVSPQLTARPPHPCVAPETGWFVRISALSLRNAQQAPELLGTLGVRTKRSSPILSCHGMHRQWMLTTPCAREHVAAALDVLVARVGGEWWYARALE
jgi:homoserine dehydrogenase